MYKKKTMKIEACVIEENRKYSFSAEQIRGDNEGNRYSLKWDLKRSISSESILNILLIF